MTSYKSGVTGHDITVFREPQNGEYVREQVIREGIIAPLAFSDIQISIKRLLERAI